MDTATGNFIVYTNREKQSGDRRPAFQGKISEPGSDRAFAVALWASRDVKGNVVMTGRTSIIAASDDAEQQLEALAAAGEPSEAIEENGLKLEASQIVLFKNGFKDAEHTKRPDMWGRWNPGNGERLVAVSAWLRKDRYERAMLAGQSSYPQPGVEAAKEESTPTLEAVIASGQVTTADKIKPEKRAGRGR